MGHIHVRWNLHHVCATGAVNGPAGFAVFLLSHCTSVTVEVLHEGWRDFLGEPGGVGGWVGWQGMAISESTLEALTPCGLLKKGVPDSLRSQITSRANPALWQYVRSTHWRWENDSTQGKRQDLASANYEKEEKGLGESASF